MKTVTEWSLEFDRLYDNISSNRAPGFTAYEKSAFLTRAQEAVVVALYNGSLGQAFESTEATTDLLDTLVRQVRLLPLPASDEKDIAFPVPPESGAEDTAKTNRKVSPDSHVFQLPDKLLFRTYEACSLDCGGNCKDVMASVVPVTQDELFRTRRNPFKGANNNRVLRLAYADAAEDASTPKKEVETRFSELISKYPINYYIVRYIEKPSPIILANLTGGLTINGETEAKTCLLPEVLHQTILSEAVRMAKAVWNS